MLEPELMAPSGKAAGIAVLILDHTRIRDTLAEALVLVLEFSQRLCHNGLQSWVGETVSPEAKGGNTGCLQKHQH